MATKKQDTETVYITRNVVWYGGKRYGAGEEIKPSKEDAKSLLKMNAIRKPEEK